MPLRVSRLYGQPYKGQQLNHTKNLKVLTGRSSDDCKLTETFSFPGSTFYWSRHRHNRHWANLVPRAFPGTRLAWGLSLIQSNMYIGSLNFIRLLRAVISRFFEGEPNEIYRHVSEKGSKGRFFLACVAGTKRGGVGDREKGKREGSPPPPLFPFLPIPYPFRRLLRRLVLAPLSPIFWGKRPEDEVGRFKEFFWCTLRPNEDNTL